MNAPNTVTRDEFAWRTETCNTCDNHGYDCYDCNGEGSWNASCADCSNEKPLNDDGVCAECAALTECVGDPLLQPHLRDLLNQVQL